jgi:hypothetical protein
MSRENPNSEFDRENRIILQKFLAESEKNQDRISGSVLAIVCQFILNLRIALSNRKTVEKWIEFDDLIDLQVEELRKCVVDLLAYKALLTKGDLTQ